MSISYESRENWATKCAQFWQKDTRFWSRYMQDRQVYHSQTRHASYVKELLHHRSHQPEF